MKEKINIAELLKNCPSGMELDCTMFDDVYFDYIDDVSDIINCYIQNSNHKTGISFNKYGHYLSCNKAKCVIFPKGKTTWEGFVPSYMFKDGDVIANNTYIAIFHKYDKIPNGVRNDVVYYHCWRRKKNDDSKFKIDFGIGYKYDFRFATEEEKQKLFDTIKANGYKWDEETKTLKKLIKPKFKVEDIIKADNRFYKYKIIKITDTHYTLKTIPDSIIHDVEICEDKNWKLIPNKFDISTLKSFESKVLVRDINDDNWIGAFYSHYKSNQFHMIGNVYYYQCIPYEGNEHLLGNNNDCDDFYKNW